VVMRRTWWDACLFGCGVLVLAVRMATGKSEGSPRVSCRIDNGVSFRRFCYRFSRNFGFRNLCNSSSYSCDGLTAVDAGAVSTSHIHVLKAAEDVLPASSSLVINGFLRLSMTHLYYQWPTSSLYQCAALSGVVTHFCSPLQRVISIPSCDKSVCGLGGRGWFAKLTGTPVGS